MSSKRILIISPTPTHPRTAGNRARVSGLLTSLINLGHDIYFCFIQCEGGDDSSMRAAWGDRYFTIPYTRPRTTLNDWLRKIRIMLGLQSRYTYSLDEWYDNSIDGQIASIRESIRFDAVIVEYVFFSRALLLFGPEVLKIIDTHDVFTDRHLKYIENGLPPRWYSTTRGEEARGLMRSDIVLAIQDKERDILSAMTDRRVITVGHMIDLCNPRIISNSSRRILFVASDNSINKDALEVFVAEFLPLVRESIPDIDLAVAGSICNSVVEQDGVSILGVIDDLAPAYESSAVVINPVRFKTGLSIKNLEAMGYSKPLVTTSAGSDGMEDGAGSAFLVADNITDFSRYIVRLLTDLDFARHTANQAYQYAASRNRKLAEQLQVILG